MTTAVKYPRTFHLPWSPGATDDDKTLQDVSHFEQMDEVVITEKMDGENTSMYRDFIHTRSLSYVKHPSRSQIRALHAEIRFDIPPGWRICGENLTAVHSIEYEELPSYFMVFSIWNELNVSLAWGDVVIWADLLNLPTVPVLYQGPWDEKLIRELMLDYDKQEGYVVRNSSAFMYEDFSRNVAKFVRAKHVQTDEHWMTKPVVYNKLKEKSDG